MLLSSHIVGEVEAVCDWVTIIRSGRVVKSGALTPQVSKEVSCGTSRALIVRLWGGASAILSVRDVTPLEKALVT